MHEPETFEGEEVKILSQQELLELAAEYDDLIEAQAADDFFSDNDEPTDEDLIDMEEWLDSRQDVRRFLDNGHSLDSDAQC